MVNLISKVNPRSPKAPRKKKPTNAYALESKEISRIFSSSEIKNIPASFYIRAAPFSIYAFIVNINAYVSVTAT